MRAHPMAPTTGCSSSEHCCYHEDKWRMMGWMFRCLLLVICQCHSVACGFVYNTSFLSSCNLLSVVFSVIKSSFLIPFIQMEKFKNKSAALNELSQISGDYDSLP